MHQKEANVEVQPLLICSHGNTDLCPCLHSPCQVTTIRNSNLREVTFNLRMSFMEHTLYVSCHRDIIADDPPNVKMDEMSVIIAMS